ncbi:MAG: aminotransferase class IV family protein [Acidimicrobiales bacterium]|nr:aminotransferase class IV family protein [Acidimicrobiales bacterium]
MSTDVRRHWVSYDGRVLAPDEPTVSGTDAALMLGQGIFETMRVVHGEPFAMTRHLRRLRSSAAIAEVEVPWNDTELRAAAAGFLRNTPPPADGWFGRLRMHVSSGAPSPLMLLSHVPEWGPTASVVTVDRPIDAADPLRAAKVSNRLAETLAMAEAKRRGADEALRFDRSGRLSEGGGSNVFLVVDGVLVTPALSTGCLPGVARGLVVELVDVEERDDLTAADLARASEVFLTSSTRGVHPVDSVDGRCLDTPGPVTAEAARAYSVLRDSTVDP